MDSREVQEDQAARLVSLVHPHLPVIVGASADQAWDVAGPAFIARMTGTLEAIVQLRPLGRAADEIILGGSLFDHVATFAWLAADEDSDLHNRFAKTDAGID